MSLADQTLESAFSSDLNFSKAQLKKFVDPELLNSVGLTRVIVTLTDDIPLGDVTKHMTSARATPSFDGFRIVRGIMSPENIKSMAADPHVISIVKDKKIEYDTPVEFSTFSSLQDMFKFRFPNSQSEEESLDKPETTLRDVTNITGASKTWETYDINGTGTTIAIVDTGVDYGAPSLGYSDAVARDSLGYPTAFDADGESMALTNTIIASTFTVTGSDTWLETNGTDPYMYISQMALPPYNLVPPVVQWSNLVHSGFPFPLNETLFPFPMNVTGIVSQSGYYHFGMLLQFNSFAFDLFPVLVVDSVTPWVYDKAYVDMSFDWALLGAIFPPPYNLFFGTWPPELSFADETPVTPTGRTVAARDFTGDGVYDLSAGSLGYFLDVWESSPNWTDMGQVLQPIDLYGNYAVFVNDWFGHGTSCASCAAGRGLSIPYIYSGMAPGAKIMGVVALYLGDIIEADLWAAGFDLVPYSQGSRNVPGYGTVWGTWAYTGNHKADIISHSWGFSEWATGDLGKPWYDVLAVFEDALTVPGYFAPDYPGTVITHAGGNGGAGYGTITEPEYATLPITVGASTSMNWTHIAFGFAGGSHDEVISWSARGPTALGNVKPDVVNVGAYGWVSAPVWYGLGDGTYAYDLFGGTSMATPLTAGASALAIQAYSQVHGSKPSPELSKVILKSSAKDLGYDAFVQGSGRVDTFAAVELVLAVSGVTVTSSATWDNVRSKIAYAWATSYNSLGTPLSSTSPESPIDDVSWFAGTVKPGESATTEFTIRNPTNQPIVATITPVTHEQIGTPFTYSGYTGLMPLDWRMWLSPWVTNGWRWGNLATLDKSSIPDETDLMIASLSIPYQYFDQNHDYSWDRRWGIFIFDWVDAPPYGVVNINEVYLLNYAFNFGTTNEARVSFPLSKIKGNPVILVYQSGILDPVPFKVSISYYKRNNWTWIETPSNISVSTNSFKTFTANLTVPNNTPQGVYEGQMEINIITPYEKTIAVPISLQVPAILADDSLVYNLTPLPTGNIYNSFKVNGYFDWSWRYESGDWKQWVLNLQDSAVVAAFVSSSWTGSMTDIDMFAINPMGTMIDGATSPNPSDGVFEWQTRTGANEEYVVLNTSNFAYSQLGTYTVLLHNVLFDGTIYPENVTGTVDLVKLFPRGPITVAARSGHSVSQSFTIMSGRSLTNIKLLPYIGLSSFPVEFTPDNITYINALGSAEFTVGIDVPSDIPEGIYPSCFLFQADELPFPIFVLVNIVVDNTSPSVTIVSPKSEINVRGNITVEAYANDKNGIERMEFEVENTPVAMTFDNMTGHWIASLDTTTLEDGLQIINVKASDKAGNVGSTNVAVTIDNSGPLANIDAPADNSYLHGTTKINVTGQDTNFNRTELYINGRLVATWNLNGTVSYQWDTVALADGAYIITLKVYDNANNFAADEISVTIDNTPPIAEIRTPATLDYVKGNYNITIFAYDANLQLIQLSVNGSSLTSWSTNGVHSFIWNTSSINGPHTIMLSVYDKTGTKTERTVIVTVDDTLPTASITKPQNGAELSGTTSINFTASDINLKSMQLFIDQSAFNVTGATYQWDTTKVGDGIHVIKLKAYDKAGNTAETSVSVSIINSKLNLEANKNLYLLIGTPLGFMLGVLIAYIILKRKK
jgi:subtilisin family serine protease